MQVSNFITVGELTNVVVSTRGTTTTMRVYKDGVLKNYIEDGFEPTSLTRTSHLLGKSVGGQDFFKGHILSIAIWSRSLAEDEVERVYGYGAGLCSVLGL